MEELPVTEARAEFSELVSRVAYGGVPVMITRHGKPLVAMVPAAYLDGAAGDGQPQLSEPSAEVAVLDLTGRASQGAEPFGVAAQHRQRPTSR